ncbi:MAG: ParB/RepB/Spo0J family partition protein [Holosporales bacterium]|jgi:ParB family chromosome partitioning protein|nr:ParB/RepB/Spo0J family partition protein [Holosporales bacterium]
MSEKKILGRGLSAIFDDLPQDPTSQDIVAVEIEIKSITTDPKQPRKFFDEEKMSELIQSIKNEGVLQPILVRKIENQENASEGQIYQIIAGERRWRASAFLQRRTIPAIVLECGEQTALQLSLIENLQREGLTAIEEAATIKRFIDVYSRTQEEVAVMISKSRSYVANALRLLKLPQSVQELIQTNQISVGHARAIVESDDPEAFAQKIVAGKINVRETEKLARLEKKQLFKENKENDDLLFLETKLSEFFHTKVQIIPKQKGAILQMFFEDYNALDKILAKVTEANIFNAGGEAPEI